VQIGGVVAELEHLAEDGDAARRRRPREHVERAPVAVGFAL
jgi:hypothetical protein